IYRAFGNAGKGTCTSGWWDPSASPLCNKRVNPGTNYDFSLVPLSGAVYANQPARNYNKPNTMNFAASAGQTFYLYAHIWDYDALSANDNMCMVHGNFAFTDAQLQTLNTAKSLTAPFDTSDGTCDVHVTLKRIN